MALNRNLQIKIGVGVLIFKNGKVLLAKRKGSHGAGEYAFPGGHLEFGESFADCAKRECKEEAGIEIKNIRFLRLLNLKKYPGKHYVDIGLVAEWKSGQPKALEPHKATGWNWYNLNGLPKPMFQTIDSYLEALKTGKSFFDN